MTQRDELNISGLCESDVSQIAEIEKLCFSDPWSRESLKEELTNPLAVYFVCRKGETVLGYIGTRMIADVCEIENVAVHPEHRRRGIAEKLLNALFSDLSEEICDVQLEVRESNEPARALYEKLGFCACGRRKNYYEKPREDAILYTRHIKEQ